MQLTHTSDQRPVDLTHCTVRIILRARATFTHSYSVLCSLLSSQHFFCSLDMAKRQVTSVFPHRSPCLLHESSHSKVLRIQWRCGLTRLSGECVCWFAHLELVDWELWPLKKCFAIFSFDWRPIHAPISKTEKNVHGSSIYPRSQMTKRNSSKKPLVSWLPSPEMSHPQVVLARWRWSFWRRESILDHSRLLYL